MMKLDANQIDLLKMKYLDHAQDLRFRTDLDFKLLSGFITVDLFMAAWLSQHQLGTWLYKIGFVVLILGIGFISCSLFMRNMARRKIVIEIMHNINEAMEFTASGAYLKNRAINPEMNRHTHSWLKCHLSIVVIFSIALVVLVVFGNP